MLMFGTVGFEPEAFRLLDPILNGQIILAQNAICFAPEQTLLPLQIRFVAYEQLVVVIIFVQSSTFWLAQDE